MMTTPTATLEDIKPCVLCEKRIEYAEMDNEDIIPVHQHVAPSSYLDHPCSVGIPVCELCYEDDGVNPYNNWSILCQRCKHDVAEIYAIRCSHCLEEDLMHRHVEQEGDSDLDYNVSFASFICLTCLLTNFHPDVRTPPADRINPYTGAWTCTYCVDLLDGDRMLRTLFTFFIGLYCDSQSHIFQALINDIFSYLSTNFFLAPHHFRCTIPRTLQVPPSVFENALELYGSNIFFETNLDKLDEVRETCQNPHLFKNRLLSVDWEYLFSRLSLPRAVHTESQRNPHLVNMVRRVENEFPDIQWGVIKEDKLLPFPFQHVPLMNPYWPMIAQSNFDDSSFIQDSYCGSKDRYLRILESFSDPVNVPPLVAFFVQCKDEDFCCKNPFQVDQGVTGFPHLFLDHIKANATAFSSSFIQ
jgi:hypothetical protein